MYESQLSIKTIAVQNAIELGRGFFVQSLRLSSDYISAVDRGAIIGELVKRAIGQTACNSQPACK
jgi:F0F1-type ATP synthase assembly protein I